MSSRELDLYAKAHNAERDLEQARAAAKAFVAFVLRHTLPARAAERSHEETYSIIAHHPFATDLMSEAPSSPDKGQTE